MNENNLSGNQSDFILYISNDGDIQSRIYAICGVQAMIDRDLASLYDVEKSLLNKVVISGEDYGIAKCDTFKTVSHYNAVEMLTRLGEIKV
ncbi:hypothetical protein SAMN04488589_2874 [Methanolobus vulcani]|jgi:hypothetical protein|uniref:Uncharacterized protein n=1 Tax=Methanolobus vulcani TaxID=38026 RepID=A0A7Z7AZB2_9EURY|nr:hypothetical protein [Methanolobus vulcani]SDG38684.1 hypothetical protein SAMN04488589_2874 [Methanolobus vulcani]